MLFFRINIKSKQIVFNTTREREKLRREHELDFAIIESALHIRDGFAVDFKAVYDDSLWFIVQIQTEKFVQENNAIVHYELGMEDLKRIREDLCNDLQHYLPERHRIFLS